MAMTTYLENKLLEAVLKNTAYTSPSTVYLALYSVSPGESGTGTELSGSGYSRQAVTFGTASTGTIASTASVTFGPATGTWSPVVAVAIVDASSGGNVLFYKATATQNIKSGGTITIDSGDLTITLE